MAPAGSLKKLRTDDIERPTTLLRIDDSARDRVRAKICQLMTENVRFLGDEFQIELSAVKLLVEGTVLQELKKGET